MSDEQINKAIAEMLGWTDILEHPEFGLMGVESETHGCRTGIGCYTHDLNAMAEAEHSLAARQFKGYLMELLDVIHEPMLASARQRAEAFLRALGKWEEVQG